MFERRLKILLTILVFTTAVLIVRAAYLQVVQKEYWRGRAAETMKRSRPIETWRGSILDVRGNEIAVDRPCIDACFDFRALTASPDDKKAVDKWIEDTAVDRVHARLRDGFKDTPRAKRKELVQHEVETVRADLDSMWDRLAKIAGKPADELKKTRDEIVKKVTMRRRAVWYRNYQLALQKFEQREPPSAWRRWLVDESAEAPTPEMFTNLVVAEELEDHPILRAVNIEVQNELRKHVEDYPGLVLKPGVERYYPYNEAGCHVLGTLSRVTREDLDADPNVGKDELRQYLPNDLIGRSGIEKLAEPLLRGSRGKIVTIEGRDGEVGRVDYVPGKKVQTTLDIELQHDIGELFHYCKVVTLPPRGSTAPPIVETVAMHGAAVVIDVATDEVRALVSYPTFDLNELDDHYEEYLRDELNNPMLNRATQAQLVPGSTVKPMVGMGAITDGLVGVNEGIECTGYLVIGGKRIHPGFRCWVASNFEKLGISITHHPIPVAHIGHDGNADGFLTFSDGLQRSCNVYFETLGGRLGIEGLSKWYYRFGLGRPTGIGIAEARGRLPISYMSPMGRQQIAWYSAIGQVQVTATPIQMANVAATIARGGVWMRPKLLHDMSAVSASSGTDDRPERIDLGIKPEALAAARQGMTRVVNTVAGTGRQAYRPHLWVAGKTGTATATALREKVTDADGTTRLVPLEPSLPGHPNPKAPWYRGGADGSKINHAWFIGFAPADNPKIAVAVMVEYGVSGGGAAGALAAQIFDSCVERGYLKNMTETVTVNEQ